MNESPPPSPMSMDFGSFDGEAEETNPVMEETPRLFLDDYEWREDGYLVPVDKDTTLSTDEDILLLLEPVADFMKVLNPTTESDEQEEVDSEKGGDQEDATDEFVPQSSTPPEYMGHRRVLNLLDKMRKAVSSIDKMVIEIHSKSDSERSAPRSSRQSKLQSLERQQQARLERLQKQQSSSDSVSTELSSHSSSTSQNVVDKDAVIRLVRAINSIRTLVPVVIAILNHRQRHDENLTIHSVSIRNESTGTKKRKKRVFLIGEHVFDVTTASACQSAKRELGCFLQWTLFRQYKDPEEMVDSIMRGSVDWNTLLPSCFMHRVKDDGVLQCLLDKTSRHDHSLEMAKWCDEAFVTGLIRDEQKGAAYDRAMHCLRKRLETIICRRFKGARLTVYGSCLSDLYLGESSDVDMSLYLPEAYAAKRSFELGKSSAAKFERTMSRLLYNVTGSIEHFNKESSNGKNQLNRPKRYQNIEAVVRARVPVIKGTDMYADNPYTQNGSLNFDICFLNEIAVANSSLLREYSLVDVRVKLLMLAVKRWTQHHKINSAADQTLSSYAWMNLVVFYLQCLGFVPNLQCPTLLAKHGLVRDPQKNPSHAINDLNTLFLTWKHIKEGGHWSQPPAVQELSVTVLLYGFFYFYDEVFSDTLYAISIRSGRMHGLLKSSHLKSRLPGFCIEDPFETFDSHAPHDLAAPCSESSQAHIRTLWKQGKEQLEKILFHVDPDDSSWKKNVKWLWPQAAAKKHKSKKKKSKHDMEGIPKSERYRRRKKSGQGERKHPAVESNNDGTTSHDSVTLQQQQDDVKQSNGDTQTSHRKQKKKKRNKSSKSRGEETQQKSQDSAINQTSMAAQPIA